MQDELASQVEDLQERMNNNISDDAAQPPVAAAAPPEYRKAGGNPIKHIITGQRLAASVI